MIQPRLHDLSRETFPCSLFRPARIPETGFLPPYGPSPGGAGRMEPSTPCRTVRPPQTSRLKILSVLWQAARADEWAMPVPCSFTHPAGCPIHSLNSSEIRAGQVGVRAGSSGRGRCL
jgi:hypothetical protein